MREKKAGVAVAGAALLIILHFLLFPYPLGKELVARPAWAARLEEYDAAAEIPPGPSPVAGFRLGGAFGYVRGDGRIQYLDAVSFQVALSDSGFINYSKVGSDWVLQDASGARIANISGWGYPILGADGSRVFIVKTDLSGVGEVDKGGDLAWSRDFASLMTCLSISKESALVGLLDGSVELLGPTGSSLSRFAPGESRINVIYGCSVSGDGSLIATISGIDPQYLTIMKKKGETYTELSRIKLASDFRREAILAFSPDGALLVCEGEGAVGLYQAGAQQISWTPIHGRLRAFSFQDAKGAAVLLSQDGQRCELGIVTRTGRKLMSSVFASREVSLGLIDGQPLVCMDGVLIRLDLEVL